jgi:peroxisomal coenzyme A diphosphatase NUDT7
VLTIDEIKAKLKAADIYNNQTDREAAVLLPLVTINRELHILFQVRSLALRAQPGEICFPGGKIEPTDRDAKAAAIRECTEELGIDESDITVIAALPPVHTPQRTFIFPFLAEISSIEDISINDAEVDSWFTIPVAYLLSHPPLQGYMNITVQPGKGFPIEKIANRDAYEGRIYQMPEYFYEYNDYIIWGLTGRILKHFLDRLQHK